SFQKEFILGKLHSKHELGVSEETWYPKCQSCRISASKTLLRFENNLLTRK
ncbi:unnamed protein product, partial [Cuscuta campestris]